MGTGSGHNKVSSRQVVSGFAPKGLNKSQTKLIGAHYSLKGQNWSPEDDKETI